VITIFLNTKEFSLDADLRLEVLPTANVVGVERRVSRMKLLDETVHVEDQGFSEGDKDFLFSTGAVSVETVQKVRSWFTQYTELILSVETGTYLVAPRSMSFGGDALQLSFMSKMRLDSNG